MYWIGMLLGTLLEIFGDVLFKEKYFLIGALSYGLGTVFWALALQYSELSKAVVTFTVINVLAGCSLLFLNESLSLRQSVGALMAVLAVLLIEK